ncbi:hypothetical protein [Photobacterium jeanii]|nr:hypothetical protein [Photobacterium jeanii]
MSFFSAGFFSFSLKYLGSESEDWHNLAEMLNWSDVSSEQYDSLC